LNLKVSSDAAFLTWSGEAIPCSGSWNREGTVAKHRARAWYV